MIVLNDIDENEGLARGRGTLRIEVKDLEKERESLSQR